mgnify:CR=1 FL=1
MPYKEFETEEEFKDFKEELLKGYAKIENVVEQFSEVDLEGDDLEDIVSAVAEIKEDLEDKEKEFEDFKEQVKKDKTFAKREQKLKEVGVDVSEDDKEDIVDMSKKAFSMLVESNKEKMDATADKNSSSNFDPNLDANTEDEEFSEILKNM